MSRFLDIFMITIDTMLAFYFLGSAFEATDMIIRLIACAGAAMEVCFVIRHIKMIFMRIRKNSN